MAKKRVKKPKLITEIISEDVLIYENSPLLKYEESMGKVNSIGFDTLTKRAVDGELREHYKGIVMISSIQESYKNGKVICLMDIHDLSGFQRVMMTEEIYNRFKGFVSIGKIIYFSGTIVEAKGIRFLLPESMEIYPRNVALETPDSKNSASRLKSTRTKRATGSSDFSRAVKKGEVIEGDVVNESFIEHISKQVNKQFGISEEEIEANVGTGLKSYMNAEEIKNFMWLFITAGYSDFYLAQSVSQGNVTQEEFATLSGAMNGLKDYVALRMDRTDDKTNDRINKKIYDGEVRLFDKYMINKLREATEDVMESVLLERREFEDFAEITMRQHCRNCKMDQNKCSLNTLLYDNLIPESGKCLSNCPYAYIDEDTNESINAFVTRLREIRRERAVLGNEYRKNPEMSLEFMSDMAAINKGIEALIRIKNGEVK